MPLVRKVLKYVYYILKTFGVYDEDVFPPVVEEQQADAETVILPYVDVLARFRDAVKDKANEGGKELLILSD